MELLLKALKERREEIGLSQGQLAKRAGIGKYLIAKYESGRQKNLLLTTYLKICDALVLDAAKLLIKTIEGKK